MTASSTKIATAPVSDYSIGNQWDELADIRYEQIKSGTDISYNQVLIPCVLDLLRKADRRAILDVGSGLGFLTAKIAQIADSVVGVDVSARSVELAISEFGRLQNLEFYHSSIEDYANITRRDFTTVTANMFLMDVPNLEEILILISNVLHIGDRFIFTICHPCYWPRYWDYEKEPWFKYDKEILVESEFKISCSRFSVGRTVHAHRPLEMYLKRFRSAGFVVEELREPMPTRQIMQRYPKPWDYPRFIAGTCIKQS